MTAFVIRAITEKPITVIENGGEILAELKRQGNNLNQAVRGIYNGLVAEEEIRNCKIFYRFGKYTQRYGAIKTRTEKE